jgi:hypothetical protein
MNANASQTQRVGKALLGFLVHAMIATSGGLILGFVVNSGIGVLSRGASTDVQALVEIIPFVVVSALLAAFASSRWFRRAAPFVGLLGLLALYLGGQELWRAWSPSWSHQTREDYVLSQLFGTGSGCHDSECLYVLFFGLPFVCLTTYSLSSLVTLYFTRKIEPNGQ